MSLTTKRLSTESAHDQSQEDEEVFEITDFTNASDWEKFIAQVEESVTEWQLNNYVKFLPLNSNELANGEWKVQTSIIKFSQVSFTLELHQLKQRENTEQYLEEKDDIDDFHLPQYADDMMNIENDFPPRAHCLARWYGLRCFLVLAPTINTQSINHSQANLLRSSANIALHNTSCDVPLFMQIQERWHQLYTGCAVSQGVRSKFEMANLRRVPPQYAHISGLAHVFRTQLGRWGSTGGDKLQVSARFTYVLTEWDANHRWPVVPPSSEGKEMGRVPNGCVDDPVCEMQLAALWPSVNSDEIMSEVGFDPTTAPEWSLRLVYADNQPCLLSIALHNLLTLLTNTDTMSDLMSKFHRLPPPPPSTSSHTEVTSRDMGDALARIAEGPVSARSVLMLAAPAVVSPKLAEGISKAVSSSQHFIKRGASSIGRMATTDRRLPHQLLRRLTTFIFADDDDVDIDDVGVTQMKAAPRHTLTHRIAVCAASVNLYWGGVEGVAQLWHVLLAELRCRLDEGRPLPALKSNGPDHRSCLLHQKLQMLNCCIARKRAREELTATTCQKHDWEMDEAEKTEVTGEQQTKLDETDEEEHQACDEDVRMEVEPTQSEKACSDDEEEEDEFFECESDVPIDEETRRSDEEKAVVEETQVGAETIEETISDEGETLKQADEDTSEKKASGRLKRMDDVRLLHVDAPLYIPVTQDHALLTEDQLEEQAEIFAQLGDSHEGSQVRAKMQSASLAADMSAFKAANPGCALEDFVRWYSPRDFVDGGTLSPRMRIADNLWMTTWRQARSQPAHHQKRLFDDTKEAEKVLHFLTNITPARLAKLLLPVCVYDALLTLQAHREPLQPILPSLTAMCAQIESRSSRLFRRWDLDECDDASSLTDLLRQIDLAECMIERSRSLAHKFADLGQTEAPSFVRQLLEHPQVKVEGAAKGRVGKLVRRFFFAQQEKLRRETSADVNTEPQQQTSSLPQPAGREFILRCNVRHPSDCSQKLPQRLYALLRPKQFRLATAVSTDSTFF